jgi:hypothetical protein
VGSWPQVLTPQLAEQSQKPEVLHVAGERHVPQESPQSGSGPHTRLPQSGQQSHVPDEVQ